MSWINDIGSAIVSTFTTVGNAVLDFLKTGFTTLFLEVSSEGAISGVSNFGIFGFVIMGISLVLGLTYFLVNLIRKRR